ncbi:MAG TPA: hypothetical protein VF508_07545 [Pyrinomonadaceae bacterium]
MAHRIRYAMTGEMLEKIGSIVEVDEAYVSLRTATAQGALKGCEGKRLMYRDPVGEKE